MLVSSVLGLQIGIAMLDCDFLEMYFTIQHL